MNDIRKGSVFGGGFPAAGLGIPLDYTADEQTFLSTVGPSHWLEAGARAVIDGKMALVDRVSGTVYTRMGSADPTVSSGINSKPTLVFTGLSWFGAVGAQKDANADAWTLIFVCSNLNAGSTSRILIGQRPDNSHASGTGVLSVALATGVRLRLYDGADVARLDANSTYDFAGNERCACIGFDTTNGISMEVDGNAAGTDAADTNALDFTRFVLFAGSNSARSFTLPFYGEWAMTAILPYNLYDGEHATEKTAMETYVNGKYGITFA